MESRLKIHPHILTTLIDRCTADSLMYITVAGTGMLVLNTHKAANDLLERRGHNYSDRPRFISRCPCDSPWYMLTGFASHLISG